MSLLSMTCHTGRYCLNKLHNSREHKERLSPYRVQNDHDILLLMSQASQGICTSSDGSLPFIPSLPYHSIPINYKADFHDLERRS